MLYNTLFVTLVIVKSIGTCEMTTICNTPNNNVLDHETIKKLGIFSNSPFKMN